LCAVYRHEAWAAHTGPDGRQGELFNRCPGFFYASRPPPYRWCPRAFGHVAGIPERFPLSTRVRVTTAGGFASKASIGISSVCLGLRLRTCNTHWLGWAPPVNPLSGPSRCDRPKHTNGPPRFPLAGSLLPKFWSTTVMGNDGVSCDYLRQERKQSRAA